MKKKLSVILSALMLVAVVSGCGNKTATNNTNTNQQQKKQEVTVTVSAAASLKDVFVDTQKGLAKTNPEIKLDVNYGASGALRKQIEDGAPVDLFVSADTKNVKTLVGKNKIDKNTVKNVCGNTLVLIKSNALKADVKTLEDIKKPEVKKIALADATAPVGVYAKESLTKLNLFDSIKDKVVYGKDVKVTLSYVDNGNADVGIVYASDAKTLKNGTTVLTIDESSHKPIVYAAGVISDSKNKEAAEKVIDYLLSSEGQQIFNKYGFKALK